MIAMESPCQGCGERFPACHDSCPKYAEFRGRVEKAREVERGISAAERYAVPPRRKARRRLGR